MPQVPGLPASPLWAPEGTEMQEPGRTSERAAGEQEAEGDSSAEPGHPVGRWLSRLLGYGKKAWPREAPPPVAPLSRYDALLSPEETPAADFSEPPSDASASPGSPTGPTLRAGTPIDIEEPHALPASAGRAHASSPASAAPIAPSAPPGPGTRAERGAGVASAALSEILCSMRLSS